MDVLNMYFGDNIPETLNSDELTKIANTLIARRIDKYNIKPNKVYKILLSESIKPNRKLVKFITDNYSYVPYSQLITDFMVALEKYKLKHRDSVPLENREIDDLLSYLAKEVYASENKKLLEMFSNIGETN